MKRILVVEDNENNRYLTCFLLKYNSCEVIEATTGKKAIELFKKESPDLILMDIQLPDIDGLEATKRIRKLKSGKDVPIIAITSFAMAGDKEKLLQGGCSGYILKPINPETFMDEIKRHL